MGGQVWEVVGGKKDGLLVRTGKPLKSPEAPGRLAAGSRVEELELEGERLHYRLLLGEGPGTGWVSLRLKGGDLLVRCGGAPEGGAPPSPAPLVVLGQLPSLQRGAWRVLLPASAPSAHAGPGAGAAAPAVAGLHVCSCVICETGHMLPALRIARAVCARPRIRKVSLVTNVYGARKIFGWLEKEPDATGKLELVEFEDGWDQAQMDRANEYAQEEDGCYHNQCNDGIGECAYSCLQSLVSGEDPAACFVCDLASQGFRVALSKLDAPQPVVGSTPLSTLAYALLANASHGANLDGDAGTGCWRERLQQLHELHDSQAVVEDQVPDVLHCFELPPLLAAVMPPLPRNAVPVGIIADEVILGQLPQDLHDFLERAGPPVLYVSMGSVATFSREQLAKVVEALQAPGGWRVLWSLRQAQQELLPAGGVGALGADFFVSSWLPQAELLQHPKVIAFLSHCGWGACCEAIVSGKPVVAFPMFADQYMNAYLLDAFGMARTVAEEPVTMDPASSERRLARLSGVRTGDVEHTRKTFTAEGLRADVAAVLKGRQFQVRAKAMQTYSKQFGGAKRAAEEIEQQAAKALQVMGGNGARSAEWPTDALKRFRAVARERRADLVLAARGDAVCQFAVTDGGKCFIDVRNGQVTVHDGEAVQAHAGIAATEADFLALWQGRLEVFDKLEITGNKARCKRLAEVFLLADLDPDHVDSWVPADGVIRPPPGRKGPSPHPQAVFAPRPDWLKPDGQPEKKNKLLFLSLPWAGHIVHLKRIASWFAEHPKYEVHFAYLSERAPELPRGVIPHGAEAQELTPLFDDMQNALKELAMKEWCRDEIPSLPTPDLQTEGFKVQRFMTRVLLEVKPAVLVADSAFSIGNWLQALCQVYRSSLCFVVSPGIKEKWVANQQQASPGSTTEVVAGISGFPDIDITQVMTGKFDISTLPPGVQAIVKLPGFDALKLISVFMAMTQPDQARLALFLYPSSSWMVEVQPGNDREIFTGTLLPLPKIVDGEVQLSRSALQNALDPELYTWLFDEAIQDPVVYIAFGTMVKGVKEIVEKLVAALEGGKWRVLWSLPTDMHHWLPSNLPRDRWCIQDFVQQKDVFRCDRVRCFVSHCGANSTIEAMSCGVPMVCHPFYMDQYDWARTVRRHLCAGVQVDKFDSDPAAIRKAVTEVLEEPCYREGARAVSRRLQAQAAQLEANLGPELLPREHLGPGVSVAAALILSLMKGKGIEDVKKVLQQTL